MVLKKSHISVFVPSVAGCLGINGHGYIAGVHPKVGGGLLGLKKRFGCG